MGDDVLIVGDMETTCPVCGSFYSANNNYIGKFCSNCGFMLAKYMMRNHILLDESYEDCMERE